MICLTTIRLTTTHTTPHELPGLGNLRFNFFSFVQIARLRLVFFARRLPAQLHPRGCRSA